MPNALLSTTQVAALYCVDSSTVRRWIEGGLLKAQRIGSRSWAIDEHDLVGFKRPKKGPPFKAT